MIPKILLNNNPNAAFFYNNLTEEQKTISRQYKAYESNSNVYSLNTGLITNRNMALSEYKTEDDLMNSIIFSFHLENELILYKGTSAQRVEPFIINDIYQNQEWLSAAFDFNNAQGFLKEVNPEDNIMLIIVLKNSFKGIPMQQSDDLVDEDEIVLPRDSKFRVIRKFKLSSTDFEELERPFEGTCCYELEYINK
ncbi:hypothetical protein [Pedobacter sp. N23S346]|uniref:hypothetical protein n=1 Tax=Pedobacter sp. N23S346 TaxID=3402750 RepID=UPI003ACBF8B2